MQIFLLHIHDTKCEIDFVYRGCWLRQQPLQKINFTKIIEAYMLKTIPFNPQVSGGVKMTPGLYFLL